jgi:4-hydroxy-3-polyprenylbenzoate decarboxylase
MIVTTCFQPFNTRLIVRKGFLDSSKIRSSASKIPAAQLVGQTGLARRVPPRHSARYAFAGLKIIVAITGASGALYAQRLLDNLDPRPHDIQVVITSYGQAVIAQELPEGLRLQAGVKTHNVKSMNAPFASGSNAFDAMVVIPCSMGTLGRIAHGTSEDVLLRAADVMLKERRKLILVPRETPLNLVHVRNLELLLQAGATILPANPCFYTCPKTIEHVVDTVVARVLDHLGVPQNLMPRWQEEKE